MGQPGGRAHREAIDAGRASRIFSELARANPEPVTELRHSNPYELLMATILSAQCTDERVNAVTPTLFARCPGPAEMAAVPTEELEEIVRPTGFYRNKARALKDCSQALLDEFAGRVPDAMEDLVRLPGVGRKTASLILGECFGKPGVVVDTHVRRTAVRLGLTSESDAEKVESVLARLLPHEDWYPASSRLLLHGRYVCLARKPRCAECVLYDLCEYDAKTA